MCTRFYLEQEDTYIQSTIKAVQHSSLTVLMQKQLGKNVITSGEVHPTDIAAVIASNKKGDRAVFPMIWGFTLPSQFYSSVASSLHDQNGENPKRKPKTRPGVLVNCRVETASKKPLWKDSWSEHRCIIPASYYYEWGPSTSDQMIINTLSPAADRKPVPAISSGNVVIPTVKNRKSDNRKMKYTIRPRVENNAESNDITYLAGLYRMENGFPHFAVLTREPGESIRFIHDRMPVILRRDQINDWINPHSNMQMIEVIVQTSLTDMDVMRSV